LQITPQAPYQVIYSLSLNTSLGPIIEPYVVQLNEKGMFTLSYQRVYTTNVQNFSKELDETDYQLIRLMDDYAHETIARKFHKKYKKSSAFFNKEFTKQLHEKVIRPYIEHKLDQILPLLRDHRYLYLNGEHDNPTQYHIALAQDPVNVIFHFKKHKEGTRYYPVIRNGEKRIKLKREDSHIICFDPCWVLVNDKVYHFDQPLNGKKLLPFLNKMFIEIPPKSEPDYYKKFIGNVIKNYKVKAEGFKIKKIQQPGEPVLKLTKSIDHRPSIKLAFKYGDNKFNYKTGDNTFVKLTEEDGRYAFLKINRNRGWEDEQAKFLQKLGLEQKNNAFFDIAKNNNDDFVEGTYQAYHHLVDWINQHRDQLERKGFEINQEESDARFFIGNQEIDFNVKENNDWFDVYAKVKFGEFQLSFIKLKNHILQGKREFELPNGEIAILPEVWFSQLKEIFNFSEQEEDEKLKLRKHHFNVLENFNFTQAGGQQHYLESLKELKNSTHLHSIELPQNFSADLRSYQKEGYSWLYCLKKYQFGGVLADDMGLGKTVQTLALLLKEKEEHRLHTNKEQQVKKGQLYLFGMDEGPEEELVASSSDQFMNLIAMPASLLHNWEEEINSFAPSLKYLKYVGNDRHRLLENFPEYDLILTTYGMLRNDIEYFREFKFNYMILDESQVIKNPDSKISKVVKKVDATQKLVLTGTPIENSLMDLWSQMAFLNPGLLGDYKFFKKAYVLPIEKKNDEAKREKLKTLIKPFILRRTKEEVAKDLPSLTEKTQYCELTPEQEKVYEATKSNYRNQILENIDKYGFNKSQFLILKGLTQLRLIANHPHLIDRNYEEESGKFNEILRKIENVISENHKILVFSQFVRHLNLFKDYFEQNQIGYSFLTGSTKNRKAIISDFRNNPEKQVFLISLKAGGVGLNLVEADYVFIVDPWWNPATESQAINRAHRIGQDKRVISYKFISKGTIEEKILKLQNRKSELAKDIVQSNQKLTNFLTEDDLEMLLN